MPGWPHWTTPGWFLDLVRQVAPIVLDPYANGAGEVQARNAWHWPELPRPLPENGTILCAHSVHDALDEDWYDDDEIGRGLVFVNPNYDKMRINGPRMCQQGERGLQILGLVPSSTDAEWWHQMVKSADVACFWKGRIRFDNPPAGSKVDQPRGGSFVPLWGKDLVEKFIEVFEPYGEIVRLKS